MPKLSDTQLVILNAACQRDDRAVLPLPKKMGGEKPNLAASNSIKSMLKHGLIEEVDAKLGEPMWRETGDGHGVTLAATDAAFEALGIETGAKAQAETNKTAQPAKPQRRAAPPRRSRRRSKASPRRRASVANRKPRKRLRAPRAPTASRRSSSPC
jgi:hypothetical protein